FRSEELSATSRTGLVCAGAQQPTWRAKNGCGYSARLSESGSASQGDSISGGYKRKRKQRYFYGNLSTIFRSTSEARCFECAVFEKRRQCSGFHRAAREQSPT